LGLGVVVVGAVHHKYQHLDLPRCQHAISTVPLYHQFDGMEVGESVCRPHKVLPTLASTAGRR